MHLPARTRGVCPPRRGKILALFAILLPVLCGMIGLVIDTGLMMAAHRDVQNAADSAAMAAALRLMRGDTAATATTEATTFVQQYNGLAGATVTTNIGPSHGPHAGNANYAEVIVTYQVTTLFMGALGVNQSTVSARAVAGFEPVGSGEGVMALDPRAIPGISVGGNGTLKVNGSVVVNSWGKGVDQYGQTVDWGFGQYATTVNGSHATFQAQYLQVHGGVDSASNYQNITTGGPNPVYAGAAIAADPLANLPVPTQSNVSGITNWTRQAPVKATNGSNLTLQPGVYEDIQISNGATVTFKPGVYILSPKNSGEGLSVTGGTVTGNGVMFYLTGSDYLDQSPGYWDNLDGAVTLNSNNQLPAAPAGEPSNVVYASLSMSGTKGSVNLTGITDTSSPWYNMLFFQRRRDQNAISLSGNAGSGTFGGVVYAKWANFSVSGNGTFNSTFIVGSTTVSGNGTVTVNGTGKSFGAANEVFLVE
jgi:Flp pilus assembly protein TadG